MRAFVSWLYRRARLVRDVEVLASGDSGKAARRAAKKILGRSIIRRAWLHPSSRRRR